MSGSMPSDARRFTPSQDPGSLDVVECRGTAGRTMGRPRSTVFEDGLLRVQRATWVCAQCEEARRAPTEEPNSTMSCSGGDRCRQLKEQPLPWSSWPPADEGRFGTVSQSRARLASLALSEQRQGGLVE